MSALKVAAAIAGLSIGGLALASNVLARRSERLVPAAGRYRRVKGARLHFVDVGWGPTIVMIHGLNGQMHNLTYGLVERLKQDHRVIVIDRPGSGYSTWTGSGDHGLPAQAEIIAQFIRMLKLGRPLVVGHSLGGAIALRLAVDHANLISGLALIAPVTQPLYKAPAALRPLLVRSPVLRFALAYLAAVPVATIRRKKSLKLIFGPDRVPDDFAVRGGGALAARPSAIRAASAEMVALEAELPPLAARYGEINVPVNILFGRDDRILEAELHGAGAAAAINGADLRVISGGHMLPVTAADETANWIREHPALRERTARGSTVGK